MRLPRSDLIALARKYRWLSELRRAELQLAAIDNASALRALAREFPGALRELDILSLAEIDRRSEALEHAARSGAIESWMEWMHAYHATMRAALSVKQRLRGQRRVSAPIAGELAAQLERETGVRWDTLLVQEVANPPAGRLNTIVFRRLSMMFHIEPNVIGQALFPSPPSSAP
jgi:hypothetical protein